MNFPSWRYHRTEQPRIVRNPDEDEALGEGWADTPAAFLAPEVVEVATAAAESIAALFDTAPEDEAPAAGESDSDTPSEGGEAPAARGRRRKKAE